MHRTPLGRGDSNPPCGGGNEEAWWARQDSNLRQRRYERRVLTAELRAPTQHPAPFCLADTTDQANWKVAGKARLPRDLAQLRQAVGLRVDEPIGCVAVRAVDAPGGIPHAHGGPVIVLGEVASRRIAVNTRSEEHTSELQSLMRQSYDVF